MNVGEYIKQLRLANGLSQEELGKIVGVQRAAVQKWECGKVQNLKRETIKKLSELFNVSPSSFIEDNSHNENINTYQLPTKCLTDNEETLLGSFRKLNDSGQAAAVAMVNGLTTQEIYKKTENNQASKLA